jgi:hypothetical protein
LVLTITVSVGVLVQAVQLFLPMWPADVARAPSGIMIASELGGLGMTARRIGDREGGSIMEFRGASISTTEHAE